MKRIATTDVKPQNRASFTLDGRVRSKKNSKQIVKTRAGRSFLKSSDAFKSWEDVARAQLFIQKRKLETEGVSKFPITGKLRLVITFEMIGRANEPDLSNLIEGPQDLLQELGIIENDKLIIEIEAKKFMDRPTDTCTIHISQSLEA